MHWVNSSKQVHPTPTNKPPDAAKQRGVEHRRRLSRRRRSADGSGGEEARLTRADEEGRAAPPKNSASLRGLRKTGLLARSRHRPAGCAHTLRSWSHCTRGSSFAASPTPSPGEGGRLRLVATRLLCSVVSCWLAGPGARSRVLGSQARLRPPPVNSSKPPERAEHEGAEHRRRLSSLGEQANTMFAERTRRGKPPRALRERRIFRRKVGVRSANSLRATRGALPL